MKIYQKKVTVFMLCLIEAIVAGYIILLSPSYLREYSLFKCVSALGFKALKCGRLKWLVIVTFLWILFSCVTVLSKKKSFRSLAFSGIVAFLYTLLYVFSSEGTMPENISAALWLILFWISFTFIIHSFQSVLQAAEVQTLGEQLSSRMNRLFLVAKQYYPAFLSGIAFGFLAFFWYFANKLLNHDEILYLFSIGETIPSGRWGLYLIEMIFPSFSMPWLLGIVSIILLSVSACVLLYIFKIKNRILQLLLTAAIICFPAEIGTMLFIYTSSAYAAAFLLISISAFFLIKQSGNRWGNYTVALACAVFSLSVYQANITVLASLLVALLIKDLLDRDIPERKILKKSCYYLSFLAIAFVIYYALTLLSLKITGQSWNMHSLSSQSKIDFFHRIIEALMQWPDIILNRKYGIILSNSSEIAHIFLLLISLLALWKIAENKEFSILRIVLLFAYVFFVFPLSINGLIIVFSPEKLHTLTMYSFIAIYILAAAVAEMNSNATRNSNVEIAAISIMFVVILQTNIFYSNKIGLEQYLEYENTYSIYTSVVTQIKNTEGYDGKNKVAFVGMLPNSNWMELFWDDEGDVYGPTQLRNLYHTRVETFISYYLGIDLNYTSTEEIQKICKTEEFKNMPSYPSFGYVDLIDDTVVVKFSDVDLEKSVE